jgi:pimeloyl-ACP methyl ester carboxylesterase
MAILKRGVYVAGLSELHDAQNMFGLVSEFEQNATAKMLSTTDGSSIRVLHLSAPAEGRNGITILLLGGWDTRLDVWDPFLMELAKSFDVLFLETREKRSSVLNRDSIHHLDRASEDVREVLASFQVKESSLVIYSLSWGAMVVADGLAKEKFQPRLAVLAGPIGELPLPFLTRYLIAFAPLWLLRLLIRPIARFWIAKITGGEREANAKLRILNEADLEKWYLVAKNVSRYEYWYLYTKIRTKCLILYSKDDGFHEASKVTRIIQLMNCCTAIEISGSDKLVSPFVANIVREHAEEACRLRSRPA